jgi:alpha-methylacyl-CoA racemase
VFAERDACATPVLSIPELSEHPQHKERSTLVRCDNGALQPAPAPRLSRTPGAVGGFSSKGADTKEILDTWGVYDQRM